MTQNFRLHDGNISINNDVLLITDDSIKRRRKRILITILGFIFGASAALRFSKPEDLKTKGQLMLWGGLIIAIINLSALVLTLLKTDKKEFLFTEIKSIKEKNF